MGKQRVKHQPSGAESASFRHIRRTLPRASAGCVGVLLLACSAYDNADTPGHALGSGGVGAANIPAGGSGGTTAGAASPNGGSAMAGTTGIAGTVGLGGSAAGGAGGANAGGGGAVGTSGTVGTSGASGSAGRGGGASGSGGAGNGTCSTHPLTAMSKWVVTASNSSATDLPARAIDGDLGTRWSSGKDQAGGEWLQLDFSADVTVTKVTLKLGTNMSDYPRTYQTRLTDTANNLAGAAQLMGTGASGVDTAMTFSAPATGRYLLVTQGGAATGLWWSVAEISVECSD